jgi:uncharacterized membrane protein AbrB (regulator of aidB expression)
MTDERKLPPVTEIGMLSLALIVAGGIYLASHIATSVKLAPAVVLLVASAALLVGNMIALSRVKDFAWPTFFLVAKWSLLAYVVTAGLIGYSFIVNNIPTDPLIVLVASLVIYAVHVPILVAFTVARYADAGVGTGAGVPAQPPG